MNILLLIKGKLFNHRLDNKIYNKLKSEIEEDNKLVDNFRIIYANTNLPWATQGTFESEYTFNLIREALLAFKQRLYWSTSISLVSAIECLLRELIAESYLEDGFKEVRKKLKQLRQKNKSRYVTFEEIKKQFIARVEIRTGNRNYTSKYVLKSKEELKLLNDILDDFQIFRNKLLAHVEINPTKNFFKHNFSKRINGSTYKTKYKEWDIPIKKLNTKEIEHMLFLHTIFGENAFSDNFREAAHHLIKYFSAFLVLIEPSCKSNLAKEIEIRNASLNLKKKSS